VGATYRSGEVAFSLPVAVDVVAAEVTDPAAVHVDVAWSVVWACVSWRGGIGSGSEMGRTAGGDFSVAPTVVYVELHRGYWWVGMGEGERGERKPLMFYGPPRPDPGPCFVYWP